MAKRTFRLYRAVLVAFVEGRGEDAASIRSVVRQSPARRGAPRTSAQKKKGLTDEDLARIRADLEAQDSPFGQLVPLWLLVGSWTGLRPGEWPGARLVGRGLVVVNAKATNDRSHGPTRTLLLELGEEELAVLRTWLDFVADYTAEEWKRVYANCRKQLQRSANRLWPGARKRPTLYSARHQFSADAKSAGATLAEVAAMMGHAVDSTARRHYAKRKQGRGATKVKPTEGDVARVRQGEPARAVPSPAGPKPR